MTKHTRKIITRDYQMKMLLSYYYQKMSKFGEFVQMEMLPAIAYARDKDALRELIDDSAELGYTILLDNHISVTRAGKEYIDNKGKEAARKQMRNEIFISHRRTDAAVADMIKDFLVATGIPNDKVFCSSLPGNDIHEKIEPEVKEHLKKSAINILLLSQDYYNSAYCLNEAGIAWYLEDVLTIPFGLPEISHDNMYGFLNATYKLRRLDDDGDVGYLYDEAKKRIGGKDESVSVVIRESKKLREKYQKHIESRPETRHEGEDSQRIKELEVENARLNILLSQQTTDEDENDYDDDIWEDGYHEVKNGDGQILKKGQFANGVLIDGVEYNIVIRVAKGDEENDEPVLPEELKDEKWHYGEYGQYDGVFGLMVAHNYIIEEGLQFFYVVDKKVQTIGKLVKPTFTNFRSLEKFLEENEPDELDYIKTGVRKYSQTDYADVEV